MYRKDTGLKVGEPMPKQHMHGNLHSMVYIFLISHHDRDLCSSIMLLLLFPVTSPFPHDSLFPLSVLSVCVRVSRSVY